MALPEYFRELLGSMSPPCMLARPSLLRQHMSMPGFSCHCALKDGCSSSSPAHKGHIESHKAMSVAAAARRQSPQGTYLGTLIRRQVRPCATSPPRCFAAAAQREAEGACLAWSTLGGAHGEGPLTLYYRPPAPAGDSRNGHKMMMIDDKTSIARCSETTPLGGGNPGTNPG
jgi:hypothetical protein